MPAAGPCLFTRRTMMMASFRLFPHRRCGPLRCSRPEPAGARVTHPYGRPSAGQHLAEDADECGAPLRRQAGATVRHDAA